MISNILFDMILYSTPIILCVIGGNFAYKANVLNIALEGMMLSGAFVSMFIVYFTGNIPLAVAGALVSGLLLGLLFSFLGITCKGNVIVIGLGINMMVSGIAAFVLRLMNSSNIYVKTINVSIFKVNIPLIENIPFIGKIISGHTVITYLSFFLIFVVWLLMYRTKLGIYVRTVGEDEDAAKSVGINTDFYKYMAVLIGALFSALAGVNLAMENLMLFTNNMTAGRGFIAIAAIYCGQGRPVTSSLFAIIFGLAWALSVDLSTYAGSASGLFNVVPYVLMTVVLAVVSIYRYKNNKMRGYKFE
ncbi:ABC transporter permease [Sporolactobacillus shoreae]|uniref:ABC transporter permease n=1 Tax=Sporolactobacillus shoreae TaxID=1465501 RepID=A0A4Z0GRH5_9BACL|nr:ABC transporter permease [Sporolactobacillus shoreae]TGA99919.1 ABC transporter permease [Sporolactobacillus shoreae]